MINKSEMINVYNEYDGDIYGISTFNDFGYKFEKANEFGEASMTPVPFQDIQLMNNKSTLIKEGVLTFDEDIKDEVYKSLNIYPERDVNYFTKKDIEDIILNVTDEKIEQIIKITSKTTIERFRNILTKLINSNQYDISTRVIDYINARDYEIQNGTYKSALQLPKRKVVINNTVTNEDVELGIVETQETVKKAGRPANKK